MFRLYKSRLQKYPITYFLIGINILVYIYLCLQGEKPVLSSFFEGPGYDTLLLYGGKENGLIALGQIYRLFFPMFMHANFVHLVVNMLGLWSVGRIFEEIAGPKQLFILYIIAGITGNLCSFAILPHLSVGASGSLFGVLFCLYVIQKYQEKVSKQFKKNTLPYEFGNVILINAILNILFGITFPIFDWACHLGGSIAGILIGFAIVTKHSWRVRLLTYVTTNFEKGLPKGSLPKKIFEKHVIYYIGILLINIFFASGALKVEKYQKIAGMGAYLAAQNSTSPLNYGDLFQYQELLIKINKETSPENLLYGAYELSQNKEFFSSYKLFSLLNELYKYNFIITSIDKDNYRSIIERGLVLTKEDSIVEKRILPPQIKSSVNYQKNEDYCAKPANLFMTLGFFEISGNLYECAYAINTKNDSYALKAFEAFHKIKNEQGMTEVLTLVKSFSNE